MPEWTLRMGGNNQLSMDEKGNMVEGNVKIISINDEDAVEEAKKRIKKARFYLVGERRMITFNV